MAVHRRTILQGAAALTMLSIIPTGANAQTGKRITVTNFAGAFDEAMHVAFADKFVEKTGIQVDFILGNQLQWLSQIEASPKSPPIDVALVGASILADTADKGMFEEPTVEKLPNLKNVDPTFVKACSGKAVAFNYGFHGLAYNKDRVKEPPKSFKEFMERTVKGDFVAGLPSIKSYPTAFTVVIWRLNDILGGTIDDISPVIDMVKRMKKNTVFWANFADFENFMRSGEMDIGLLPDGRAWSMIDSGTKSLGFYSPAEGGVLGPTAAAKPVNAKPEAWQFINALLEPEGQAIFADRMSYGMTSNNVNYTPKFKERWVDWRKLTVPPFREISASIPKWTEIWNKEIGA